MQTDVRTVTARITHVPLDGAIWRDAVNRLKVPGSVWVLKNALEGGGTLRIHTMTTEDGTEFAFKGNVQIGLQRFSFNGTFHGPSREGEITYQDPPVTWEEK